MKKSKKRKPKKIKTNMRGLVGDWFFNVRYIYLCIAPNKWKRFSKKDFIYEK